jgi:hypothetical protein
MIRDRYIGEMNEELILKLMNDIRNGLNVRLEPLKHDELILAGGKKKNT